MGKTIEVLGGMFDSTRVVETVDGFPRGDKAVDAAFFAQMLQCFYTDGVVRPGDGGLRVFPGDGLALRICAGCGWIRGHMAWLQEDVSVPVEAGYTYGVFLRLHRTDGRFTLEVTEDKTEVTRTEQLWDLLLGEVSVPASAAALSADMITDRRTDSTVCGAVNSPVDSLQAVAFASDSGAVGGTPAAELVRRSGGTMTGVLRACDDSTGGPAVRNIRYGTVLPDSVAEGEIFILLADQA